MGLPRHEIPARCFGYQVETVAQQAPGVYLPVRLPARFGERLQKSATNATNAHLAFPNGPVVEKFSSDPAVTPL